MTEQQQPTIPATTPPTTPPPATEPDPGAQSPEDVRAKPNTTEGSGQFCVWDVDLGQFVSGVGDKATVTAMKKELEDHNGIATKGHQLKVLEV